MAEEDFEKHESIATAPIYWADEDDTDAEDETEDEGETTEDEPSNSEPTWEVFELAKSAYTKIIETSQGLKILHAQSTLSDNYLALGEVSTQSQHCRWIPNR